MEARRVTLLDNHTTLMAMVGRLLSESDGVDLDVVALADAGWQEMLLATKPHSVVVDFDSDYAHWQMVWQLLWQLPGANLVSLRLEPPAIDVFSWERTPECDLADLLDAIRGKG